MSMKYLGETFDIHGGGMDLKFPHHENEIAQSETATGKPFARYWMHNGLTRIQTKAAGGDGEKMSKSLGNVKLIRDLLNEFPAESLRFLVLSTHYRRPIEFGDEPMASVRKQLDGFYRLFGRIERMTDTSVYSADLHLEGLIGEAELAADREYAEAALRLKLQFLERMDDDFNTAGAISVLHELAALVNRYIDEQSLETKGRAEGLSFALGGGVMIVELARLLGLFEKPPQKKVAGDGLTDKLMSMLIAMRQDAREQKNFELADQIRDRLAAIGVTLEDCPDGTIWRRE
jgi:cysteinyl-tRNA synthetase